PPVNPEPVARDSAHRRARPPRRSSNEHYPALSSRDWANHVRDRLTRYSPASLLQRGRESRMPRVTLRVLGIPGSLRAASFNRALLDAAVELAPDGMTITIFDGLGAIPPYNADVE